MSKLVSGLLGLALCCTVLVNAQTVEKVVCEELKDRIPTNLFELSEKTMPSLNLNDNCNFQPIHTQVRFGYPTTEIIARFSGKKMNDDQFAIEQVELKHFEITEQPAMVIIDTAEFHEEDGMTVIRVTLRDLDATDCEDCAARKQQLQKERIDYVLRPNTPLVLDKHTLMDVNIVNELELYPKFGLGDPSDSSEMVRPFGRHCYTRATF